MIQTKYLSIFTNISQLSSSINLAMPVQLGGPDKVSEITGRRGMLVRASDGKGVTYQARNT